MADEREGLRLDTEVEARKQRFDQGSPTLRELSEALAVEQAKVARFRRAHYEQIDKADARVEAERRNTDRVAEDLERAEAVVVRYREALEQIADTGNNSMSAAALAMRSAARAALEDER